MSIVTISRGTMSGGKLIAERLAEELDFRCVDREVIVEKAAASGVSHEELRNALDKPPSFLDRVQHKKYLYLALIQAALAEEVRTGRVVYHGTMGHLLLQAAGPVFRVRIIAPMDYRIAMAYRRLRFSGEEAEAHIQKVDENWKRWAHYLYGVDLTDPGLYDVVVNLERVDADDAVGAIAYMVRQRVCFEFDKKCQAMMDDLAVACQVKAALALNRSTSHLEFAVTSKRGRVTVRGKLPDLHLIDDVKRVAGGIAGVKSVDSKGLVSTTPA